MFTSWRVFLADVFPSVPTVPAISRFCCFKKMSQFIFFVEAEHVWVFYFFLILPYIQVDQNSCFSVLSDKFFWILEYKCLLYLY